MGVVKLLRPLSTQPVAEQSPAQLYRTSVNTVRFVSQWRSPTPHRGISAVLGIRICRILMFLGLPDPDPLVRGTDLAPDPDPSLFS